MSHGDLESRAGEDAVLGSADSVPPDSAEITLTSHHISDSQKMSNVDFQAGSLESVIHLIDDGLSCSLDA